MIPTFLSGLIRAVVIMSITGGLLVLLLLAAKPIVRQRLPKFMQYYFWLAVILALLIPISRIIVIPEDTATNIVSIYNVVERNIISTTEYSRYFAHTGIVYNADFGWESPALVTVSEAGREAFATPTVPVGESAPIQGIYMGGFPPAASTAAAGDPIAPSLFVRLSTAFMFIYPFVVVLVSFISLVGYVRFTKKIHRGYIPAQDNEINMLTKLSPKPKIIRSTQAQTPMLIGIFRPLIVLPNRDFTDQQLYCIFTHELTHMRRLDILVKWLSLVACAVHWFNPLVWLARWEIDRVCELACDEAVIRNMDATNRQNYGDTLIEAAADEKIPLPVLSTTMCTEKRAMRERLTAIMMNKKYTLLGGMASTIIILVAAGVIFSIGAGRSSEAPENSMEVYVNPFIDRIRNEGERVFVLENMTGQERLERMTSVTLYADGTASIANALISSFFIPGAPHTIFEIEDNELAIFRATDSDGDAEIARFAIIDNDTLEFISSGVPLFADVGARYVCTPSWGGIFDGWDGWEDESDELEDETGIAQAALCHCGAHYVGDNLRQPTPPINMREWHEVDTAFLDNFGARWGITFTEHGDLENPIPFAERWWGHSGLQYHTMLIWPEEEITDLRIVALGFTETDDEMTFYVRHELDHAGWVAPYSLIMVNATLHPHHAPRMGITFTDSHGVHHRMLIQEDTRGGYCPRFSLIDFNDHYATWDDAMPLTPHVVEDMGSFLVRGLGGHHVVFDPRSDWPRRHIFAAGGNFDVYGLHGEFIEGGGILTPDGIRVTIEIARNEIILPYIDGPLGTLAGPVVSFEYVHGVDIVGDIVCYPFEFWNDAQPPIYFYMPEEGAIQLARLLIFAYELVMTHREIFS